MSKIRLHGSSSGHTEVAPAAAAGNNTVTLPNSAGTLLLTDGSAASLTQIPAANIVGLATAGFERSGGFPQGITMADQYRLNTQTACNNTSATLTSNLERTDTTGQGHLGTGMSESSGLFTFPSTGIYKVDFQFNAFSTSDVRYVGGRVLITTDNNSSSEILADSSDGIANVSGSSSWATSQASTLVDITNTSTHKVKFQIYSSGNVTFQGHSDQNWTFMTFIRLGDT